MVEWGHQKWNNSLNKGLKPNKNKGVRRGVKTRKLQFVTIRN